MINLSLDPNTWRTHYLHPAERQELADAAAYIQTAPHHLPSATLVALVALVEAGQVQADWRDTLTPQQHQLVTSTADIALIAGDVSLTTIAKLAILLDARIQRPATTPVPSGWWSPGRGMP